MIRRIGTVMWYGFHVIILTFGFLLMLVAVMPVHAQAPEVEVHDLDRRVRVIEDLNLDHRLTVMETILMELKDGDNWQRVTMGGTGLLIAERVFWTFKKKAEDKP